MPSKSKSQQRLFGMVHACQKKGKCASKKVKDVAKSIKPDDAEDFAKTKHEGLPEKKEKDDKMKNKKKQCFKCFKEWVAEKELNEVGTSTGDVASFKQPIGGTVMCPNCNKRPCSPGQACCDTCQSEGEDATQRQEERRRRSWSTLKVRK
jgi:hypothetical protein